MKQQSSHLMTRIEKYRPGCYLTGAGHDSNSDRAIGTKRRVEGAAAVDALLNAAIVPPLGYNGDIRTLVDGNLLPNDQLMVHHESAVALRAYRKAHDGEYEQTEEHLTVRIFH